MSKNMKVAVVGGGVIGAVVAYSLASQGAETILLAGPDRGGKATQASFAWINAHQDESHDYYKLRSRAMELWPELAGGVPGLEPRFPGSVCWELAAEEQGAYVSHMRAWGYDVDLLDAKAIAEREPALAFVPDSAVLSRQEGDIEPVAATLALLAAFRELGGIVIEDMCTGLDVAGTQVRAVEFSDQHVEVDAIVLATGADADLLSGLGYAPPIDAPAGLLIYTSPIAPTLTGLVLSDKVHMRQTPDGSIVAGSDYGGAKVGDDAMETAMAVFGTVTELLPQAGLDLASYVVGYRPTPGDGFPIVGFVPGIDNAYVTVTHSGITLAPAIGQMSVREILQKERDPLLKPYSPLRFMDGMTT